MVKNKLIIKGFKLVAMLNLLLVFMSCTAGNTSFEEKKNSNVLFGEGLPQVQKATPQENGNQNLFLDDFGIAGERIGEVRLGLTSNELTELLGTPDEKFDLSCERTSMRWFLSDFKGNGITIYLRNNRIYHIKNESVKYKTPDGITIDSTLPKAVLQNNNFKAFLLTNSAENHRGGKNIVYWVNKKVGIAFALYFNRIKKKRLVEGFEVFYPHTDYQPEGCVGEIRKFVEMKKEHVRDK